MKKFWKKLLTTCCALVLSVVMLSGCSWLQIDKGKYYNAVVTTVGDKVFYKKDLVEAFSSYGVQYYQQGMSLEESVKETINMMIDRALLVDEIKSQLGELSTQEKLEVRKQAYDYMQDSIFTYESQIRKEWEQEIKVETPSSTSESSKTSRAAKTEYAPKTIYENGKVLRAKEKKEKIFTDNLTEHFTKQNQIVTDKDVSNVAWARYIKALQDSAKEEGRSTKEADVLLFEENRLIEYYTETLYLEKFEQKYFDANPIDVDAVISYYKEKYEDAVGEYSKHSNYHEAMKSASSEYIYYHPAPKNPELPAEYVNVKHILIKFSDEQTSALTALKKEYGAGENEEVDKNHEKYDEYLYRHNEIVSATTTTFVLDGETYTGWNHNDVFNYVKSYVTGSEREKSKKFDEMVYVFNDDEGFMNSEFDYVVNLDTSVTDQMVKPFADTARALAKKSFGSMEMVETSYGYHIIFNDGCATNNIVDEANINNISNSDLLEALCTTYTRPDSDKTVFNYIYDKLGLGDADETRYNTMVQSVIDTIKGNLKKENVKIVYYENNYKDLWD